MQTRQLSLSDLDTVMNLIRPRADRPYHADPSLSSYERYAFIMTNWYLPGVTHKLFGAFDGDRLVSIGGMRLDMPQPESWSLTNLRVASDDDITPANNGLGDVMAVIYAEAKRLGRVEYYNCMTKRRFMLFQRRFRNVSGYDEYDRWVELHIPAGAQPEHDLWWGMMGRRTYEIDLVVTRCRLKTHPLPVARMRVWNGKKVGAEGPEWTPKYQVPDHAKNGILVGA